MRFSGAEHGGSSRESNSKRYRDFHIVIRARFSRAGEQPLAGSIADGLEAASYGLERPLDWSRTRGGKR